MKAPAGSPIQKRIIQQIDQLRKDHSLSEADEKSELQPGEYFIWTVYFDDGSQKRIKVTSENFDPKAYYAKQNKVVVNVDYNWEAHK